MKTLSDIFSSDGVLKQHNKMSTIGDESARDLEQDVETDLGMDAGMDAGTCVETCDEEEIQLLEDRSAGKWIYFLYPFFFEFWWILGIVVAFFGVSMGWFLQGMCFVIYKLSIDPELSIKNSDLFYPLWPIINCLLYFTGFFMWHIYERKSVDIEKKALQKLLEEVTEMDLIWDPLAWRRIAFRVNQCFMKKRYNNSIFYSGEQCRQFFVREIVKPIESGSYDIGCRCEGKKCTDYCEDSSNKMLAERAVENYKKSIETVGELSGVDGRNECSDSLFDKFGNITATAVYYLVVIEFVIFLFMILVLIFLAFFNAFFR